jgi:hypothetical protein
LKKLTAAVFQVTGCKDVARVDFRLMRTRRQALHPGDQSTPDDAGFSDQFWRGRRGWTHEQLVTIADLAAERQGLLSREMA